MSRDSSTGVYTAPTNSFNPAVSGTVINSTHWNAALDDMETALSTTSATTRALWPLTSQVQDSGFTWGGTSTGSANAHVITTTPTITALGAGRTLEFIAGYTNTGATTLAAGSIAATAIRKMMASGLVALTGGEIVVNNRIRVTDNGTYYILADLPEGTKGADIASATTTDLGAATGDYVSVTGTTTITGLGTIAAGVMRTTRFTDALILTHNGTSLILPSATNITTAANDVAMWRSLGSGNWICVAYERASGSPISAPSNAYSIKTANYTAVAGDKILADCTAGAWTLTLPASPANTDSPVVVKKVGSYDLTVALNGKNIRLSDGTVSSANQPIYSTPGYDFTFAYRGTDASGQTNIWNY